MLLAAAVDSVLKKAIAIKPDYSDAYNNLGVSYNKLGQLEQAIKAFEQALSISPEFPDPYNNLTVVYRKQGLINDVIICFKKAVCSSLLFKFYSRAAVLTKVCTLINKKICCFP